MIVCSCNLITSEDITQIVRDFLSIDEWQLITVGMVYHAAEKRGKCCGCFPDAIDMIVKTTEAWHRERANDECVVIPFVQRIREEHDRCETFRKTAKRRATKPIAA